MDKIEEYVMSHDSILKEDEELREWELAMANASIREKCCMSINLENNVLIAVGPSK